jgi:hypothetical protein
MKEDGKQQPWVSKPGKRKNSGQLYWALGILLLWAILYLAVHFHLIKS